MSRPKPPAVAVAVRPARRADLPAIVALLADDVFGRAREDTSPGALPFYAAAFDKLERNPDAGLFVAELDGRVVGCVQLNILAGLGNRGADRALIEGVRVASDHRSMGIGETMIRFVIEAARARGVPRVQLTSSNERTDAQRFYRRLGFKASHVGMKLDL